MDGFHILARVLPAKCKDDMLGRVVVDKDHPLERFAPDERFPQPGIIVERLYPGVITYDTLTEVFNARQRDSVGAGLTEFLRAYWRKDVSQHKALTAASATHFEMDQIEPKFNKLMENDDYKREVINLLEEQSNKSLPMVTGVFTCKNLQIRLEDIAGQAASGKVRVPIGEATGASQAVDPELDISHAVSADGQNVVTIEEEVIVALRYTDLRMKYKHERRFPYFRKVRIGNPTVSVGKPTSSPRFALFYAGDDEDDLPEEEVEASIEVGPLDG